ncbi:ATP-binding protein [Croceiramulus getboli]|nr:ATP-binding protein [Flavobacteriaceae bacterium YJPT1-3]
MKLNNFSLRTRIFVTMILLVVGASILIAGMAVYQYREEAKDYHEERLERKEEAIKEHINYVLYETTYEVKTDKIPLIFAREIYKIAKVHNLQLNFYDLEGRLLKTSKASLILDSVPKQLDQDIVNELANDPQKRVVLTYNNSERNFQSSFTYINDRQAKPLAILNLPYLEDDDFFSEELAEFLKRLGTVYIFMLLAAIVLAYFLSKYITRSLNAISQKITDTRLEKRNQRIETTEASEEIRTLVDAYNGMIDELEASAAKLARSEREQAWREMAKQVAHEIKNPLTPMRLTVQSFERRFDPEDPEIKNKVREYSNTLIQQIDTMSSIASAFSNFADMPAQQSEVLNVPKIVRLSLEIFNENRIVFQSQEDELMAKFDRTQLIRVVTNLVKNAIQATAHKEEPRIVVTVSDLGAEVEIAVADNGVGITDLNAPKIFEPKFTTKTSGMGLGLGMVKNIVETYEGTITFTSKPGQGTIFKVIFPKN